MSEQDFDTSAASFFAWMGCASALVFANLGAAYGTARSGVGLCSMGVMSPGLVMKNIIPIVMAGILGIYGLIVAVIISGAGTFTFDMLSFCGVICFPLFCFFLVSALLEKILISPAFSFPSLLSILSLFLCTSWRNCGTKNSKRCNESGV